MSVFDAFDLLDILFEAVRAPGYGILWLIRKWRGVQGKEIGGLAAFGVGLLFWGLVVAVVVLV